MSSISIEEQARLASNRIREISRFVGHLPLRRRLGATWLVMKTHEVNNLGGVVAVLKLRAKQTALYSRNKFFRRILD